MYLPRELRIDVGASTLLEYRESYIIRYLTSVWNFFAFAYVGHLKNYIIPRGVKNNKITCQKNEGDSEKLN